MIVAGEKEREGESRRLLNPSNTDRPCTRVLINAAILPSSVWPARSQLHRTMVVLCRLETNGVSLRGGGGDLTRERYVIFFFNLKISKRNPKDKSPSRYRIITKKRVFVATPREFN